jgi:hypothetical protein
MTNSFGDDNESIDLGSLEGEGENRSNGIPPSSGHSTSDTGADVQQDFAEASEDVATVEQNHTDLRFLGDMFQGSKSSARASAKPKASTEQSRSPQSDTKGMPSIELGLVSFTSVADENVHDRACLRRVRPAV